MNPALDPTPSPDPQPKEGPSNLRLRVIWATLAAALLISCTFGGPVSFAVFFAAVQAVMLKEFYRIMRAGGYRPASWLGGVVGVLVFGWLHFLNSYDYYARYFGWQTGWTIYPPLSFMPPPPTIWQKIAINLDTGYLWLVFSAVLVTALIIREIVRWPTHGQPFLNLGVTLAGLLYVSLPMALLNVLAFSSQPFGTLRELDTHTFDPRRVFFLCVLIWAADTGAYFAGKNLGKHKLAPSISPGKTWEGWAGGALLTLATGWAAGYFLPDIPLTHRLVAAGVVAIFGPLGDLAESMLKRSAGVKDSGTFLPGHGGLLDRFDAFLLVLPVLALLQMLAE